MSATPTPPHRRLALLGAFEPARAAEPHGALHAAWAIGRHLGRSGRFDELRLYVDAPARTQGGALHAEAGLPAAVRLSVHEAAQLPFAVGEHHALYVLGTATVRALSGALRPLADPAPVVYELGTSHLGPLWLNLFALALSGAFRPTDALEVKCQPQAALLRQVFAAWSARFGAFPQPEIVIVPNAVELAEQGRLEPLRAAGRALLGLASADPVVLAFSRLSPASKGDQRALVLLWRHVVAAHPRATLILAGGVADRRYVEELGTLARQAGVAERVIVLGNPFDALPQARRTLMSAADAFVHVTTGVEEAMPLVVLEAMGHGLPVVASRWSGLPECVEDGATGWLVDTVTSAPPAEVRQAFAAYDPAGVAGAASRSVACDPTQLLAALLDAVGHPARRAERGAAARRAVETRFHLEATTAARLALFDRLAAAARVPTPPAFEPLVDVADVLTALGSHPLGADTRLELRDRTPLALVAELRAPAVAPLAEALVEEVAAAGTATVAALERALLGEAESPEASRAPLRRLLLRLLSLGVLSRT